MTPTSMLQATRQRHEHRHTTFTSMGLNLGQTLTVGSRVAVQATLRDPRLGRELVSTRCPLPIGRIQFACMMIFLCCNVRSRLW